MPQSYRDLVNYVKQNPDDDDAAASLGRRLAESMGRYSDSFTCSADVRDFVSSQMLFAEDQEKFFVIAVDTKNQVLGYKELYRGSHNEIRVVPREVFIYALLAKATRIILVHNHPSGDSTPSPDDVALTRRLEAAGELIGIRILDHLIVGVEMLSLRDLGLLKDPAQEVTNGEG